MNRATTLGGTGFTATAHHEFTADKPEYGASGRGPSFGIHQPGKADANDQWEFKKSVMDLLGKGINFSNLSTVNLDRKSGYARATTGLTEAIEGSASVIATTVAAGILESQDPIKAVLSVEVQSEEKVVITRKYIVGGAAEVTPERAPARAVSVKQDVREFFMARFGCDIEMDLNLFLRPEEAKEDLDLKMNAQTIQLDNKLIELGYEAVMNDATDVVDAIMRSNPAYAALDQRMLGAGLSDDDAAFKVILAADRVYCTQVFGALAKNAYAVPNLLAAVKFASAYMLGSIEDPVIILPHGPNLKPYTKKEYLNYSVAGIPGASRKPIDMKIDRAFVDEVSGAKIMVHYPRPQYQSGSARPTVGSGGLSRETTVHTYYHDIGAQNFVSDFINGGLTKCGGSGPDAMPKPFAYTPNPINRGGEFPAGYDAATHGFIAAGGTDHALFGGQASTIRAVDHNTMTSDWGDNIVTDAAYAAMHTLLSDAVDAGADQKANTRVSVAFYLAMTFGNHMAAARKCVLPLISFHRVLASMVVFDENVGKTMTDDDIADEVKDVMFDIQTDGKLGVGTGVFDYNGPIDCKNVTGATAVATHWASPEGKTEAKAVAADENSTVSDMAVGFLKLRLGMDVNNSSGDKILRRIIRSWAIRTEYFQEAGTVGHANKPAGPMPHPFGGTAADNYIGDAASLKAALKFTHDPFSFGQAIFNALDAGAADEVKKPITWRNNANIISALKQVPWLFSTIGTIEGVDTDRQQTFCAMQVMATMKPDVGNVARDANALLAAARGPGPGALDAAMAAAITRMGPVLAALSGGEISNTDVQVLATGGTGLSALGTTALAAIVRGMQLLGGLSTNPDITLRIQLGMFHLNGYSGARGAFARDQHMSISRLCDSLTTGSQSSWIRTTTCHMASAIVAAPGGRAGRLMVGYPMTGVSTSTATEAARIQLRMYMGAAVTDPESIMVLPNVSFEGISADKWTHIAPSEKQKREMDMGSPVQLTNFDSYTSTDDGHAVVHQGSVFKRGTDGALVQIKTNTGHFGKLDHPDSYAKLWGSQVYDDTM